MALTLVEAAKYMSGEVERQAVVEEYAKSSMLLQYLPFLDIPGNAYSYAREGDLPAIAFRGVNESYTEGTGIINPQVESLCIGGGEVDVDTFIVKTMGMSQRNLQRKMKIKALSLYFTKQFFKGDSSLDPRVFDGLQKRITGTQLLSAGNTSGGDALSLLKLDELIDLVDSPTHLAMNKTMRRLLTAAARNTSVGGYVTYQTDAFGQQIMMYNDLPIIIIDYDETGSDIMPFTEANPGGGSAASTSIYCLSLGDGKVTGLQSTDGIQVQDLGLIQSKPVYRDRIEWFHTIAVLHGRAAARLQGIKNAAVTV